LSTSNFFSFLYTDGISSLICDIVGFTELSESLPPTEVAALLNEYSEAKAALDAAKYRLDEANARKAALTEEAGELDNEKMSAGEQLRESHRRIDEANAALERLSAEKADLEAQREELRAELQREGYVGAIAGISGVVERIVRPVLVGQPEACPH